MALSANPIDVPAFIDSRRVGSLQIQVIALCAAVVLLDGLDTQVIGYLGPSLTAEWGLSATALGSVFSASLVGLMIGLLAIAPLADRIGRKRAIVASVAAFGLFTLISATAQGVTQLMVYRFIAGVGLGGAMPNALALTGEYCPQRRRATLVILMFCGFSLGSIVGGVLAAGLISRYGWQSVFLVGGGLPLLLAPLLITKLPESLQFLALHRGYDDRIGELLRRVDPGFEPPPGARFVTGETASKTVPVADLFQHGRAIGTALLWIVFFMNLLDFYFLQNWLPTIFTDSGLALETAVLMTTLISVGGIAAGLLSGPLMDRFGAYPVLAGLYALGTFFVAAMGSVPASLLAIATFGAGFCVSGAQKSVNAAAVIFYPTAMRSTGVGWALGIGRFGSIVGPIAGGWLIALGWPAPDLFKLAAVPMGIAAAVIFLMGRRYGAPAATPVNAPRVAKTV